MVRPNPDLNGLEQQFVLVRLVQMNGLDLSLFQFDYDQTLAALFLNADGTIYGRYGTRAGKGADSATHVSVPSFRKAMERALALHRGYPGNKATLTAKRGPAPEYPTARALPGLENQPVRTAEKKGCIHCHQMREIPIRVKWQNRQLKPADLWVYPLPENTGMKLDVDDGLRVATVTPGSPAERAGIRPGDELRSLEGQPLISQADIQWVLHHASNESRIPVSFTRAGKAMTGTIAVSGNWKETDLSWRPSSGPGLRWGVWSAMLPAAEKAKRGIAPSEMALEVKNLFAPRAAVVQQAGLRMGDVILSVDGQSGFANEGHFLAYLRLNHPPGDKAKLTVLRGTQRMELQLPMW